MHYYLTSFDIQDGESEYKSHQLHAEEKPKSEQDFLREHIRFAESTNGNELSDEEIEKLIRNGIDKLDAYHGQRIYYNFESHELTKEEFEVLNRFI